MQCRIIHRPDDFLDSELCRCRIVNGSTEPPNPTRRTSLTTQLKPSTDTQVQPSPSTEQVTCRKCHATYVPSFRRDFYADGADPKVGLCEACMMSKEFSPQSQNPHPLPEGYEKTVCKLGQGAVTCSFLICGDNGFVCAKSSSFESGIRQRLVAGTLEAKGDHCSGSPDFTPTPK